MSVDFAVCRKVEMPWWATIHGAVAWSMDLKSLLTPRCAKWAISRDSLAKYMQPEE
jgi:hypothetical protein